MSRRNKTEKTYTQKYAPIAKAKNAQVGDLLRGYPTTIAGAENPSKVRPKTTLDFTKTTVLDKPTTAFLRRLNTNSGKRRALDARLKALSFLQYNLGAELFETLKDDAVVSNLQALLTNEFKRGVAFGKRPSVEKKKKQ